MQEGWKNKLLIILGLLGFVIASLAALAEHVPGLSAFCSGFSGGCKDAVNFTLLRIPLWGWGMAYYALLVLCLLRARACLVWLIPSAIGVEMGLLWVMLSTKVLCIYCLGNLLVMTLILIFFFERSYFWQTLSLALLFFILTFLAIPYENSLPTSSFTPFTPVIKEGPTAPVAKVGGQVITDAELTMALVGSRIRDLEQEIYRMRRQKLDQMIVDIVLQKEADERSMPLEQFVNTEILSKSAQVDEADIDRYLQENKSRLADWKGSMEELRGRVRTYLEKQKNLDRVVQYAKSLEPKYGVEIFLKEPDSLKIKVNTEGSPSTGPQDAPVTILEFSDYQCPACRQGHEVVRKVREMYGGQVRWIFKNFPLKMHKDAERAAQASLCAADQNRFWDYQDVLFAYNKEDLSDEKLEQFASDLGLVPASFKECLEKNKYKSKVEKDIEDARNAGIDRTPTFVINGRVAPGAPGLEQFKTMIDEELKKIKEKK